MFLSVLSFIACSDSRHKSENNTVENNDQEAVQDKTKPGLLTENQTKLQENLQKTDIQDASNRQILSLQAKDSLNHKLEIDSLVIKISIEKDKISISRKKILNFQEEVKFYKSQQNKLKTDDSMKDAVDRINQNLEAVQGHINNEEEKIKLVKTNISKLEKELENVKIIQSPTPAPEKITRKNIDTNLDQQSSGPIDKQALELELSNLKKLNKGVNARIIYYENMLDSLNSIVQEQEQLSPLIISEDKNTNENIDQDAANQLQDLANKTISEKKNLSTEQVNAAKERNSSDTTIQNNRGFAKFIGIFFLIMLLLIGSLYFLGKSFQGKKKNK